jgi:hypothetical protein
MDITLMPVVRMLHHVAMGPVVSVVTRPEVRPAGKQAGNVGWEAGGGAGGGAGRAGGRTVIEGAMNSARL